MGLNSACGFDRASVEFLCKASLGFSDASASKIVSVKAHLTLSCVSEMSLETVDK